MSSDLMRLAGINSGYDSEAMIEQMMSAYQTKIDNQNRKLTKLQWKQEAYRDVTQKLTDFQNKYFDILNRDSYLMTPSAFTNFKTNVTTKNNPDAKAPISVTTSSKSREGSHELTVKQVATKAKLTGNKVTPEGFTLDLAKAKESNYTSTPVVTASGKHKNRRDYEFALDVKVGDVTKTVEFGFSIYESSTESGNSGKIYQPDFAQLFEDALNAELTDKFGTTGGSDDKPFLNVEASSNGKTLNFEVGGNAAVSITEKKGNFGLTNPATSQSINMSSCVTGKNTVSITRGDVTRNVSFEGVSATYFDSRLDDGNEAVLAEFNQLKEAAYRKQNNISYDTAVSEEELQKFKYTSSQAAADKNTETFLNEANATFADTMLRFTIDSGSMKAWGGGMAFDFTITSVEGGTLGLAKGTTTNTISENMTLEKLGVASKDTKLTINGKTVDVKANMTVKDFLAAVNKADANATMSYSTAENKFIVEATDMGSGGNVDIVANDFTNKLGITGTGVEIEEGKNAIFELDGVEIYHNSNSYEFDGTKVDFADAEVDTSYKIGISKNYDDVKKTIKDFVKDYNQLIDDVYGHIGKAPARDKNNNTFEPLTDAEKDEMEEKEIERWEEKAKQGVIYNDSTISSVMSQIRTALYNTVALEDGKKFGLYSMGITTSTDYGAHGKLEINEEKLDKAFSDNPDAIAKLFTDPDTGIMKKVDTILDNAVSTSARSSRGGSTYRGSLIRKAGLEKSASANNNEIYRQMEQINRRISTLQDRYDSKEDYWWTVFTNLEKMMGEMNSQSNYMASYLGGGTAMM